MVIVYSSFTLDRDQNSQGRSGRLVVCSVGQRLTAQIVLPCFVLFFANPAICICIAISSLVFFLRLRLTAYNVYFNYKTLYKHS